MAKRPITPLSELIPSIQKARGLVSPFFLLVILVKVLDPSPRMIQYSHRAAIPIPLPATITEI